MKNFSETQPKQEREDDRFPLKEGITFVLTGFVFGPSRKCLEGVSKLNGYDPITKAALKFWYCGKAVLHQLKNMEKTIGMEPLATGQLKEAVQVKVILIKGDKGEYLSLTDPE
jgi:hypothetical protein